MEAARFLTRLLEAPHRVFFFAAAAQLLLAGAWWAATLVARAAGVALPLGDGVATPFAHALAMTYGFFPLFIFGFLHTVVPRWLELPLPTRRQYALPALAAGAGATLLLPALHFGAQATAAVLLPMLVAWGWMAGGHLALLRGSRADDKLHARVVGIAVLMGIAGLAAARHALLTGSPRSAELAGQLGLWAFLVPVFTSVCHRMIPCAGGGERGHGATLRMLAGAAITHGVLAGFGLHAWTWIADLPGAAAMLLLARRWGWRGGPGKRLLTMLNVGFAWLAAAWLLHGLQSLLRALGVEALGLAPVHALAIGALSALTLAMVARLTAAGAGRRAGDDRVTWVAFWLVQAAACARVAADLAPAMYSPLLVAAALAWLGGFAGWAWRYMPHYCATSSPGPAAPAYSAKG